MDPRHKERIMSQLGALVGVVDYQRLRPFLLHHRVFTPAQITRYSTFWRIRIPEPGFFVESGSRAMSYF
jgi:hypothetical protein